MAEKSSAVQVTIAVAIIGLIGTLGAAAIANWDSIFANAATGTVETSPEPSSPAPTSGTTPAPDPTEDGFTLPTTEVPSETLVTIDPAGCTVTIANSLVTLVEEPENFSQEIRKVPAGVYVVLETTTTSFGPVDERWLRIRVETDEGWVKDDTFTIESKSSDCDF